jgi:hypothetical protein
MGGFTEHGLGLGPYGVASRGVRGVGATLGLVEAGVRAGVDALFKATRIRETPGAAFVSEPVTDSHLLEFGLSGVTTMSITEPLIELSGWKKAAIPPTATVYSPSEALPSLSLSRTLRRELQVASGAFPKKSTTEGTPESETPHMPKSPRSLLRPAYHPTAA